MKKKLKVGLIIIMTIVCVATGGFVVYVNDYCRADEVAMEVLAIQNSKHKDITIEMLEGNAIAFIPDNPRAAIIFYPGGKVEYIAYAPLMKYFAEKGILCILPEMPCNLAVLDMQAAQRYRKLYSDIDAWYIGGHSLGGSMAACCVSEFVDEYDGLILLAAYSTEDLSDTHLQVFSIYGSEDKVLNMEKYQEYKKNLPDKVHELVITGGCHAYFGNYGAQDGDGVPKITREEQVSRTVEYCIDYMKLENE